MICDVEKCAAHADVAFTGVEAVENMCLKHGIIALNGSILQLAKELDDLRKPKPRRSTASFALVMLISLSMWLGLAAAAGASWGIVVVAYRWILVLAPAVSP